jgi:hypothetical protein
MYRTRQLYYLSIAVVLVVIAAGVYAIVQTVRHLAPAHNAAGAASSLWRLFLLTAGCAVAAFALVEFMKRLSPMRSWFNRRWFYAYVEYQANLSEQADLLRRVIHYPDIYFGGRVEEVSAQIASKLDEFLVRDTEYLNRDERGAVLLGPEEIRYRIAAERVLDVVQARVSDRWTFALRALSAGVASILALVAAAATSSGIPVIVGAFIFGLTIGGPFSWTIRDLVRLIEGRARG